MDEKQWLDRAMMLARRYGEAIAKKGPEFTEYADLLEHLQKRPATKDEARMEFLGHHFIGKILMEDADYRTVRINWHKAVGTRIRDAIDAAMEQKR